MADKKPNAKSLDQIADEIQNRQQRVLAMILFYRYAKRENIELPDAPLAYNFEPGFADSIINLLADFYLNAKIKPKKKLHPAVALALSFALPEIQKIYSTIKKQVGFSGYIVDAEQKRRQAALDCFDNSNQDFKAIKREYLKDTSIYRFYGGQEKRDFKRKMIQKIMKDVFPELGIFGGVRLIKEAEGITGKKD